MFGVIGLFVLMCATCRADLPVAPPAPPQVLCGEIPNQIFSCVHLPSVIPPDSPKRCAGSRSNTCEEMTCIVRESGWLDGASVNNAKLSEHLDHFSTEHPDWTAAIQQAKINCLVPNLPAQGYHVNCPAYDVTFCILANFIKNVPPSLWSTSPKCAYARQYSGACPVCPADCFAPAIPFGSCNSCRALPRSP